MAVADWDEETKDDPEQQPIEISYDTTDRDWSKGWKLYYWQGYGGRGQYIRVMLEFCGVEWQEALKDIKFKYGDEQDKSVKAMVAAIDKVRQKGDNRTAFAVPILTHNDDFILSQCGAIVLFLAELFPNLKPSNPLQMARGTQMMMQVIDAVEEAHTASHPVHTHKSYFVQNEAADKAVTEFVKKGGRLSKHMAVFTAELKRNKGGKGWFYGDTVTFVDCYVATFVRAFGESMKCLKNESYGFDEYALLRAHRERFEATKTYQKFIKSDRMTKMDTTPSFQT